MSLIIRLRKPKYFQDLQSLLQMPPCLYFWKVKQCQFLVTCSLKTKQSIAWHSL